MMNNTIEAQEILGENGLRKLIYVIRKRFSTFCISFVIFVTLFMGIFLLIGYYNHNNVSPNPKQKYLAESVVYVLPSQITYIYTTNVGIETNSINISYGDELMKKDEQLYKFISELDLNKYLTQELNQFSTVPIPEILKQTDILVTREINRVSIQVSNFNKNFAIDLANIIAFGYQRTLSEFTSEIKNTINDGPYHLLHQELANNEKDEDSISVTSRDNVTISELINSGRSLQVFPAVEQVSAEKYPSSFSTIEPPNGNTIFNYHMAIVAFLLGFVLAIIYVLILEQTDNKIYEIDQLLKQRKEPFIGWIPLFEKERSAKKNDKDKQNHSFSSPDNIIYWFQIIVNKLLRLNPAKAQILAITSPSTKEGKTFLTNQICNVLVRRGYRVLLLDASGLNQSYRHSQEENKKVFKISDFYSDEASFSCLQGPFSEQTNTLPVLEAYQEDIEFLKTNPTVTNKIFSELRMKFDYILIDSPSFLDPYEFSIISECSDGILVVVRAGCTSERLLKVCLDTINTSSSILLGTILNGIIPEITFYESETYCWWKAEKESKNTWPSKYYNSKKLKTVNTYKKILIADSKTFNL